MRIDEIECIPTPEEWREWNEIVEYNNDETR
jgi:hypothetical protein